MSLFQKIKNSLKYLIKIKCNMNNSNNNNISNNNISNNINENNYSLLLSLQESKIISNNNKNVKRGLKILSRTHLFFKNYNDILIENKI